MNENKDAIFLPDFCSFRMLLAAFFLAELLAFLLTLASDFTGLGFLSAFGIRSLLTLWVVLMSSTVLCLLRSWLARFNDFYVGLIAFAIIQLIVVLVGVSVSKLLPEIGQLLPMNAAFDSRDFYLKMFGISSIVAVALLRYLFILHQWRLRVEAGARAKLDALQARMRPHFLFNSLNVIASLISINTELAEQLIEDLADLIRASLQVDTERMVSLEQEINIAKLYLNIELHRLDARLSVKWELDQVPMDALLPPLSLQPIIENAVYHGIELIPDGGEIVIKGRMLMGNITLSVINPLPTSEMLGTRTGNQLSMKNLQDRVNGYYAGDGYIFFSVADQQYQVRLVIPYWTQQS